jgi:hypothetical protein
MINFQTHARKSLWFHRGLINLPMVNRHILTFGSLVRVAHSFLLSMVSTCCHEVRMERMINIQSADQDHERSQWTTS